MTSVEKMEAYIDGLVQSGCIKELGEDRFVINKVFYREGTNLIPNVERKAIISDSKLDIFNMAMTLAMTKRLGDIITQEETSMYFRALMSCFASSGIYDDLFPNWKRELGVEFEG